MWYMAFRLPPAVYFVVAVVLALLCGLGYFLDRENEATKAVARSQKPPVAVPIERFDRSLHVGLVDEVAILGQVDVARLIDVTETKEGRVTDRWLIGPLYPTSAATTADPAPGVFIQHGSISDDQLGRLVVAQGPFGPIMKVNGTLETHVSDSKAVREAMAGKVPVTPNALYIDPFENGHAEGLAASSTGQDVSLCCGFDRRLWRSAPPATELGA